MNFEQLYNLLKKHETALIKMEQKEIDEEFIDNMLEDLLSIKNEELILNSIEEAELLNEIINSIIEKISKLKTECSKDVKKFETQKKAINLYR